MEHVWFGDVILIFAYILKTGRGTVVAVRDNHLVFYNQCTDLAALAIRISAQMLAIRI